MGAGMFGAQWERFLRDTVPKDLPAEQQGRARLVFYAGGAAMLVTVFTVLAGKLGRKRSAALLPLVHEIQQAGTPE